MAEWSKAVSTSAVLCALHRRGDHGSLFFRPLDTLFSSLLAPKKNDFLPLPLRNNQIAAGFKSIYYSLPRSLIADGENTGLVRGVGSKPTGCNPRKLFLFPFGSAARVRSLRSPEEGMARERLFCCRCYRCCPRPTFPLPIGDPGSPILSTRERKATQQPREKACGGKGAFDLSPLFSFLENSEGKKGASRAHTKKRHHTPLSPPEFQQKKAPRVTLSSRSLVSLSIKSKGDDDFQTE